MVRTASTVRESALMLKKIARSSTDLMIHLWIFEIVGMGPAKALGPADAYSHFSAALWRRSHEPTTIKADH